MNIELIFSAQAIFTRHINAALFFTLKSSYVYAKIFDALSSV